MPTLNLDVVVDVVCPWCFVGKRRLDRAMVEASEIDFAVRWRPFQLDASIPKAGMDRAEYMTRKFGDLRRVDEIHARLHGMGLDLGIEFAFDRIEVSPNTFDAHRLIHWAQREGKADAVVERLFALYFEEGRDIGDPAVLAAASAACGMDPSSVRNRLAGAADAEAVQSEIDFSARIGVTGVPCTIISSKYAISGAQEVATFVDAFRQIAAQGG